jgi:polyisoprenoid-binding protein YceI
MSRCSVDVTIQTTSVDTAIAARDQHLRSPDFLDTERFPTMRFVSKRFLSVERDVYRVRGALTLHGVTKPMTAVVHYLGEGKDPWGGWRAGAECSFWLDRSDYGMKPMLPGVANRVDVWVGLEGVRQPKP